MAEHEEGKSVVDKIKEKLHLDDSSSSSSDSDDEKKKKVKGESAAAAGESKAKMYRLFGRERPVHQVLGGGKPADVFLWRNKKISAGTLGGATVIWILFELLEYHLLTLVCYCLIVALAILFLWASATTFINKSPPRIPDVSIPEDLTVDIARSLSYEINRAIFTIREIASGRNLKAFLAVIAGLWFLSIIGSCCNFLTLFYIAFVLLHTVPVLYEKYEDQVDSCVKKAMEEFQKHYAVFHEKVVSKIPRKPLKDKSN